MYNLLKCIMNFKIKLIITSICNDLLKTPWPFGHV